MDTSQPRVLVADDEPHIRRLIGGIIAHLGGQVVAEAGDGEEALQLFELTQPDLAVLDINMPRMTGDEVLRRLVERRPGVLAVMMTAQDSVDVVGRCLDLGAANYILKSNPAEEILRLMAEMWPALQAQARPREGGMNGCLQCNPAATLGQAGPEAVDRLDLEALAAAAEKERAYDETVKVRVSQDDIRKLVARRRRRT